MLDQIMTLVGNYAFPIAMCIVLILAHKSESETVSANHRAEVEKLSTDFRESLDKLDLRYQQMCADLRQTILDNTKQTQATEVVLTRLAERLQSN